MRVRDANAKPKRMSCSVCDEEATVRLRYANLRLCPEHFAARTEKVVAEAIRSFRMFTPKERLLVAISGGKDSLALWHILGKLGYQADGVHLDLGIEGYSATSRRLSEEFARGHGYRLWVVSVAEELGDTLQGLVRRSREKPCSLCGVVKRYLLNKFAWEGSYDVLLTGHNLDDETATLLGNLLRWEEDYLARQQPVLPGEGKLVRRAKPLIFLTREELKIYCLVEGIDYVRCDCPNAEGARSIFLRQVLAEIEERYPATKLTFLRGFLKLRERFRPAEPVELHECPSCGMPTAAEGLCRFCRLKERVGHGTRTPA